MDQRPSFGCAILRFSPPPGIMVGEYMRETKRMTPHCGCLVIGRDRARGCASGGARRDHRAGEQAGAFGAAAGAGGGRFACRSHSCIMEVATDAARRTMILTGMRATTTMAMATLTSWTSCWWQCTGERLASNLMTLRCK